MTDADLIAFARGFRDGILDGRASLGMCFAICAPLAALLQIYGIECELENWENGIGNHYWIALPDGRVLDPTGDQSGLDPVYLGAPVAHVHTGPSNR